MKRILIILAFLFLCTSLPCDAQTKIIDRVSVGDKSIALSIEDISSEGEMNEVLAILKAQNCVATFFCSVEFLEKYPHLIEKAINLGNKFENHGMNSSYWGDWSEEKIEQDIRLAERKLKALSSQSSNIIRPPYCYYEEKLLRVMARNFPDKLVVRGTNVCDWTLPDETAVLQRLEEIIQPGMILNINIKANFAIRVLPQLVKELIKSGYQIKTIGKMAKIAPWQIKPPIVTPRRPDSSKGWSGIIRQLAPVKPSIALTFDDGGSRFKTVQILDILRDYGVSCTFFLLGEWVANNADLVKRMLADGHEIANHTYSHPDLTCLNNDDIYNEVVRAEQTMINAVGVRLMPYFRPPYGAFDCRVADVLQQMHYKYLVLWSIDTRDWSGIEADNMVDNVLRNAQSGSIVLFHLQGPHTASAIYSIIPQLKDKGYELTTITKIIS